MAARNNDEYDHCDGSGDEKYEYGDDGNQASNRKVRRQTGRAALSRVPGTGGGAFEVNLVKHTLKHTLSVCFVVFFWCVVFVYFFLLWAQYSNIKFGWDLLLWV